MNDGTVCVSTYAGSTQGSTNGQGLAASFNSPNHVTVDSFGNLYVTDYHNNKIRKIDSSVNVTTFAGSSLGHQDGAPTTARFRNPIWSVLDGSNNLYVTDYGDHRVRKLDSGGNVTTFAGGGTTGTADGQGTTARFDRPAGAVFDSSGNLFVVDNRNHRIRKIDTNRNVTTFAGSTQGYADGQGTAAKFNHPIGIAIDALDNLYVTDTSNHRIRKISPDGNVTTVAGSGTAGGTNGQGAAASFNNPWGIVIDSAGVFYIGETVGNRIRRMDSSFNVTSFAGTGATGSQNGVATSATFNNVGGLALFNDSLFVADRTNHLIRKIKLACNVGSHLCSGTCTDLTTTTNCGVCGNVCSTGQVCTSGQCVCGTGKKPCNNTCINDSEICVETFAGSTAGYTNAQGTSAQFNAPLGLARDSSGNLYVVEAGGHRIRKVDINANVTLLAGSGNGTFGDGTGAAASFREPQSAAIDGSGNLFIGDWRNHKIRKVTQAGVVTTFAGAGQGYLDGTGTGALFMRTSGVAFDGSGNLIVADQANQRIRKITSSGVVTTIAGIGTQGFADGSAASAQFYYPTGVVVDGSGNIFVADQFNHRIRKIDTNGNVTTFAGS